MASKAQAIADRLNSAPIATSQKEYDAYLSSKNNTLKNTNTPTKKTVTSSATSGRTSSGLTWAKDAKEETDPYRKASNDFNSKYDAQIRGIAEANGVDLSVGREMFTSNLEGGLQGIQFDPYKGGGVATNWDEMVNDWSNLKNAAITSTNQDGRTVTNSYGREVNTSDLLPTGVNYGNTTGSGDPKLDAIIRQQGLTYNDGAYSVQQYNQQPFVINQGYNINDVNNMMGQMGQQVDDIESMTQNGMVVSPMGMRTEQMENQLIANHLSKSLESSGISINGELDIDSNVSIGQNGESMYKTNQGYFATTKDGHAIKIDEDNYNNMLMSMYGIEPIYSPSNPDTVKPNSDVSLSASGTGKESIQTKGNKELEANKARTALENGYITDYGAPKPILNTFIESARSMIDWNYSQSKRMSEGSVDCSSLIGRAMQMAGITNDPFVTTESMTTDKRFIKISKSEIQPGDILWEKGHAAIFLGNNKTLEARYSTKKVGESTLGTRFTHAYRINV